MRKLILAATAAATLAVGLPSSASAAPPVRTFTNYLCVDMSHYQAPSNGLWDQPLTIASSSSKWGHNLDAPADDCMSISPTTGGVVPKGTWAAITYNITDPALKIVSGQHWDWLRDYGYDMFGDYVGHDLVVRQHASTDLASLTAGPVGSDVFSSGTDPFIRGNPHSLGPDNKFDTVTDASQSRWSVSVICAAQAGCDARGRNAWLYSLIGAKMTIADSSAPDVSDVGGTFATATKVRARATVRFAASDAGAGLYRTIWKLDGAVAKREVIGHSNDGTRDCTDVVDTNSDPYEFKQLHPCVNVIDDGVADLDVGSLMEGDHRLQLLIEDAAGNTTTVLDRTVEVDNYMNPALGVLPDGTTNPPKIAATAPKVGTQLTATPGYWVSYPIDDEHTKWYEWERCDDSSTCTAIPGAHSDTYTPTEDDAGYRLRFVVTDSNQAAERRTERSSVSDPVTRPATTNPGTDTPGGQNPGGQNPGGQNPGGQNPGGQNLGGQNPGGQNPGGQNPGGKLDDPIVPVQILPPGSKLAVAFGKSSSVRVRWTGMPRASGRLTTATGAPLAGVPVVVRASEARPGARAKQIGTVLTDAAGQFTYTVGRGPSRVITFSAAGQTATVRIVVAATITLKVSRARAGRTTWLTGRLAHLGRKGIKLELQALDGNRWRTFDTTTTRSAGAFRYGYRFKKKAIGRRFALRVLVASPVYPFARGTSSAAWVRVTR